MELCRFCLETKEGSNEELVAPCKCSGSIKYLHPSCLKKWVSNEEEYIDKRLTCNMCETRYGISFLPILEDIPEKYGWAMYILNNGICITSMHEFIYIMYMRPNSLNIIVERNMVYVHAYTLLLYAILFTIHFRVNNMRLYLSKYFWGAWWGVPLIHMYVLANCYVTGNFNRGLISKLFIHLYWLEHIRALKKVNMVILKRE
jgi:E3 ubiquitin-protein ligase DOA10